MCKLPASCSFMKSFYGLKKHRHPRIQVVSESHVPARSRSVATWASKCCRTPWMVSTFVPRHSLRLYCRRVEHDWFQATWFACQTTMCFSNAFWHTTNPATCSEGKSRVMFEGCSERKTISTFLPDVIYIMILLNFLLNLLFCSREQDLRRNMTFVVVCVGWHLAWMKTKYSNVFLEHINSQWGSLGTALSVSQGSFFHCFIFKIQRVLTLLPLWPTIVEEKLDSSYMKPTKANSECRGILAYGQTGSGTSGLENRWQLVVHLLMQDFILDMHQLLLDLCLFWNVYFDCWWPFYIL